MTKVRILSISSQVAFGPVGNSATVPAMEWRGHEVMAVPTVILSNHPGHGKPALLRMPAPDLAAILGTLEDLGALNSCQAVLTGYFVANDQIHGVARILKRMKAQNPKLYVLVDPIIGDGQAPYVPVPVAEAIRDHLLPLASCITPNRFELEWLTGRRISNRDEAIAAARATGIAEVLATSIAASAGTLATLAITNAAVTEHLSPIRKSVPHGTGDFLSGLYLAERLHHEPERALPRAMATLSQAIKMSAGSSVLDVTAALHGETNNDH